MIDRTKRTYLSLSNLIPVQELNYNNSMKVENLTEYIEERRKRRLLRYKYFLFCILIFVSAFLSDVYAEDIGIKYLKINPYGNTIDAIDTISWYASDDQYFIFLPSDTVLSSAKVYLSASNDVIH